MNKEPKIEVVKKPDFNKRKMRMDAALTKVIWDLGHLITAEVAAESPYRTGRLRRSHRARIRSEFRADVIGWTPYLPYVLYGTSRGIRPNNWPERGVKRSANTIRDAIRLHASIKEAVS